MKQVSTKVEMTNQPTNLPPIAKAFVQKREKVSHNLMYTAKKNCLSTSPHQELTQDNPTCALCIKHVFVVTFAS